MRVENFSCKLRPDKKAPRLLPAFLSLAIPCILSEEGDASFPRFKGRRGYIIGASRDNLSWRVRFPGNKHPTTFPKHFIRALIPAHFGGIVHVMPLLS